MNARVELELSAVSNTRADSPMTSTCASEVFNLETAVDPILAGIQPDALQPSVTALGR
jgi:hypothetical protein